MGRSLARVLHPYLREFLSAQPSWSAQPWSSLKLIAVAGGPGSFTGSRIGVVTARTLGQQLAIPVYSVSSLAILAWLQSSLSRGVSTDPAQLWAVQMSAKREEIFGGLYESNKGKQGEQKLLTCLPDQLWSSAEWEQVLSAWPEAKRVSAEACEPAPALSLVRLALSLRQQGQTPTWAEALPLYCRHPAITMLE